MAETAAAQSTLQPEPAKVDSPTPVATAPQPEAPAASVSEAIPTTSAPKVEDSVSTEPEMASVTPTVAATPAAPSATEERTVTAAPEAPPIAEAKENATEEKAEPQNSLTKRFTEAEWAALKAFRLPDIFADAFPEKTDAKTAIVNLWGVPIDPTDPKSDARVSVVLMKFLRARNLNTSAAREMFVATLRWRESFNIEAALKEQFPVELFGKMGIIYGHDKEKRPVVYNIYGGNNDLKAAFSDVQRFIRWRVALQERSTLLLDFNEIDQMIQVHDYAGVSLSSRDANSKAAASESSSIFGAHYPEMLYKKFFVNVPMLLNWIFWAFKALVPSATMAKMSVVGTGTSALRTALSPYIEETELPKRYGGQAEGF